MDERNYVEAERGGRSSELDLAGLSAAISRKKWWIITPTAIVCVLVGIFVNVVSPRYTAEAQILLENQETFFTRPERTQVGADPSSLVDAEAVGSQVQLVTSRDLARRAIRELGLAGNPEFDPSGGSTLGRLLASLGLSHDTANLPAEDRMLENFQDKITAFSPTKTRVITIDFQSKDPELAARAANKIADLYMEIQSDAKRSTAKAAAASLADLVTELRLKLAKANADAEAFRSQSGLLAGTNNMTITGQQLVELNSELSKARTSQADAQAKASLIRDMIKQGRVAEVPDVANNDLVRRVGEQRVTLRAQLALESRTLMPGHPRIKELNAQLADLDSQLRSVANTTVRTLENDARVAGSRVANLDIALSQQKKLAGVANVDDVHLRELERLAQAYKDQLDSSTTKYQEAMARESSQATPADARIISRAVAPRLPSYPKKLPFIGFGVVATLVMSAGTIVASELLSGRAYLPPPDQVPTPNPGRQSDTGRQSNPGRQPKPAGERGPLFARLKEFGQSAAQSRASTSRVDPEPRSFDAVETLAARIEAGSKPGRGTRIVATNVGQPDAATKMTTSLARRLARGGRAILVDLEEGSQRFDGLVGPGRSDGHPGPLLGLSDLLSGDVAFAQVIHRDGGSRLHVLPAGSAPVVDYRDFDLVLDALSETYEFVLLVAPPFDRGEMAAALAPHAEFTVLTGADSDAAATDAEAQLKLAGAKEVLLVGAPRERLRRAVAQHIA